MMQYLGFQVTKKKTNNEYNCREIKTQKPCGRNN